MSEIERYKNFYMAVNTVLNLQNYILVIVGGETYPMKKKNITKRLFPLSRYKC